jgi:hypothetical protein
MRSALYSLFTTLLLLIPVSAIPLMAIFGVPQFTPVVASPLDESSDEDWDRPLRRKPKAKPKTQKADESDIELLLEETPNWEDSPVERKPLPRKPRSLTASNRAKAPAEQGKDVDRPRPERVGLKASSVSGKKRPAGEAIATDEEGSIQQTSHEIFDIGDLEDEAKEFADVPQDRQPTEEESAPPIKGYRRQRPGAADSTGRPPEKAANRTKRAAPPPKPPTWTEAVERLNNLGIRSFRLEPGVRPGEFCFTCSYTHSKSPHVTRRFEAEADEPLTAVGKVLAQVEEWAQQRDLADAKRTTDSRGRRQRQGAE